MPSAIECGLVPRRHQLTPPSEPIGAIGSADRADRSAPASHARASGAHPRSGRRGGWYWPRVGETGTEARGERSPADLHEDRSSPTGAAGDCSRDLPPDRATAVERQRVLRSLHAERDRARRRRRSRKRSTQGRRAGRPGDARTGAPWRRGGRARRRRRRSSRSARTRRSASRRRPASVAAASAALPHEAIASRGRSVGR